VFPVCLGQHDDTRLFFLPATYDRPMTDSGAASAQAEVSINADPETVYHLITDLPTLASLAEEAHAME
jgi:hypothetical protein